MCDPGFDCHLYSDNDDEDYQPPRSSRRKKKEPLSSWNRLPQRRYHPDDLGKINKLKKQLQLIEEDLNRPKDEPFSPLYPSSWSQSSAFPHFDMVHTLLQNKKSKEWFPIIFNLRSTLPTNDPSMTSSADSSEHFAKFTNLLMADASLGYRAGSQAQIQSMVDEQSTYVPLIMPCHPYIASHSHVKVPIVPVVPFVNSHSGRVGTSTQGTQRNAGECCDEANPLQLIPGYEVLPY
ncbi:hypothetical protein FNV43_RR13039 [Rhamnella rubrinervis]|uniref:Uncharacterized protein n=1 Tax=Rhamnella rubrinervis TaxID=2594499 RepID=A0A8K0H0B4_9ROSA|nr:hypothetical protein FNV43_RR13039 [Rhamnella rubrinervis]